MSAKELVGALLRDLLPPLVEEAENSTLPGPVKLQRVMATLSAHVLDMAGVKDDAERKALLELVNATAPAAIELLCKASKRLYAINRSSKCGCVIC
jgi:hypothetical protein